MLEYRIFLSFSIVDFENKYCFVGKTDEENSLVCLTENVPNNVTEQDDGWKASRIQGILDFSLIGILSKISTLLAENNIGIFSISTYNTDYILTKMENDSGTDKNFFNKSIKTLILLTRQRYRT